MFMNLLAHRDETVTAPISAGPAPSFCYGRFMQPDPIGMRPERPWAEHPSADNISVLAAWVALLDAACLGYQ